MIAQDTLSGSGALPANLGKFVHVLRTAGVHIGIGQTAAALEALCVLPVNQRNDVRAALHGSLISRRADRAIFDLAFDAIFRNPQTRERAMAELLPQTLVPPQAPRAAQQRLAEALRGLAKAEAREQDPEAELTAEGTASAQERLMAKDFAQMNLREQEEAQKALARLDWRLPERRSRRFVRSERGVRIDPQATLRAMARHGDLLHVLRRSPNTVTPPLVVLCDISGSMAEYSRMVLHFLHGLSRARGRNGERIETFLFGTRLTRVTLALAHRDVDEALAKTAALAPDWEGGTRIGTAFAAFNRHWARRVLTQGAHILLITDGLERDDPALLAREAGRLQRSARGITWANPLLRFQGFEARAQGIKALKPYVDVMRPVHNLNSVEALARALSGHDETSTR